jgi:hypothetical protein
MMTGDLGGLIFMTLENHTVSPAATGVELKPETLEELGQLGDHCRDSESKALVSDGPGITGAAAGETGGVADCGPPEHPASAYASPITTAAKDE